MGQYFLAVNLDKKQYIHAHRLGGGLKLGEIAYSTGSVATALVYLLADNTDGRWDRGEDLDWSGDRVVLAGDYGKLAKDFFPDAEVESADETLYNYARNNFEEISQKIIDRELPK